MDMYTLTDEDIALVDKQFAEALVAAKARNGDRELNRWESGFIRYQLEQLIIDQRSSVTVTMPLSVARAIVNTTEDADPETAHEFIYLVKQQEGFDLND